MSLLVGEEPSLVWRETVVLVAVEDVSRVTRTLGVPVMGETRVEAGEAGAMDVAVLGLFGVAEADEAPETLLRIGSSVGEGVLVAVGVAVSVDVGLGGDSVLNRVETSAPCFISHPLRIPALILTTYHVAYSQSTSEVSIVKLTE